MNLTLRDQFLLPTVTVVIVGMIISTVRKMGYINLAVTTAFVLLGFAQK